jgi:Fur family ferric uptake transcriptional regulator
MPLFKAFLTAECEQYHLHSNSKFDRVHLPIDNRFHLFVDKMQEKIDRLKQFVLANNLRWTSQRQAVAATLFNAKQHLTTEELFQKVQKKGYKIGYATVSRTLHLLVEAGLCGQIDISDGSMRYEVVSGSDHHDHLICTHCGTFIEVYSKKLETIQTELVRRHNFKEQFHKLQIFGICADCRRKRNRK